MGVVIIGDRRVELAEFISVCRALDKVQPDESVLRRLLSVSASSPKHRPAASSCWHPTSLVVSVKDALSYQQARAVLLAELIRIMQTRSCHSAELATFVVELLNGGVSLLLGKAELAIESLANACCGIGLAYDGERVVPLSDVLKSCGIQALSLTQADFAAFGSVCTALTTLSSAGALALADLADAVSALTSEALQTSSEPFALAQVDVCRPLPGCVTTASNLRVLLKGSSLVDSRKNKDATPPDSIRCLPQYHGAVRQQLDAQRRAVVLDLNSAESSPLHSFHQQPQAVLLSSLLSSVAVLASGSQQRLADILRLFDDEGATDASSGWMVSDDSSLLLSEAQRIEGCISEMVGVVCALATSISKAKQAALKASVALDESVVLLQRLLSIEVHVALEALRVREQTSKNEFMRSESTRKERMDAQYAIAAKDPKKAKKLKNLEFKARSFAFVLGHGTTLLRAYLQAEVAVEPAESAANTEARLQATQRALDPLSPQLSEVLRLALTSSNELRKPKRAKGTRDFGREEMMVRERVFDVITRVFQRHGATAIDTPVFELRETLMGKYGEDSKLIYDLADQGGEKLSLRYDLTVPFARYLASHSIRKLKRYHVARVYRRDNPAMSRGRFREFYQCDFDIAGDYDTMIADAEVLSVLVEVLEELDLQFKVKFNHRRLLDAIMEICGVPSVKFRTICSAIDKLDKEEWSAVRDEMLEKGLSADTADRIGTFVARSGDPFVLLHELRLLDELKAHDGAGHALDELETLFGYLQAMGVLERVSFDLSLARGLDYYTGAIYEAVLTDTDQVGSIAAGGRYDELVGMFSPKRVPAVGVSIGIERIFTIVEQRERERRGGIRKTRVQVLVGSVGGDLTQQRMQLCAELWSVGIVAEFLFKRAPKMQQQIEHALDLDIPFMLVLGADEIQQGIVNVKHVRNESQESVPRAQLADYLKRAIAEASLE